MTGYVLHPEVYGDLEAIRTYIAEDDADAADRVMAELFDAILALVRFPYQGYRRPNITSRSVRFKLVHEYVICLCAGENAVVDCGGVSRAAQPPCYRCDSERSRVGRYHLFGAVDIVL